MNDNINLEKLEELIDENDTFVDGFLKGLATQPDTKEAIDSLMALPEEQFMEVSQIFLTQMAEVFNSEESFGILREQIEIYGVEANDLVNAYEDFCTQIDEHETLKDLSENKRNFYKVWLLLYINSLSEAQKEINRCIKVPIELCDENAQVPTYANPTDAGMDIYAIEDVTVHPGETVLVHTGIKVAIPAGYELQVRPKSGKSLKTKFRVGNAPGTIDSGYRDEVCIIIDNIEPPIKDIQTEAVFGDAGKVDHLKVTSIEYGADYSITKGEKIAQLVLSQVPRVSFFKTNDISIYPNDGRNGGFGSTDNK